MSNSVFHRAQRAVVRAMRFAIPGAVALIALMGAAGAAEVAGSQTRGGAYSTGRVIRVTSLADSGTGTLRAALAATGPRVIVFDIAGPITLTSDITITNPYVTIAGQTAPDPGIALFNGSVRIRTHDVLLQHIAVRPGSARANVDAISIGGGDNLAVEVRNIGLENVSATWATDEAIGIWAPASNAITIRASIIAQTLLSSDHSMGMLIGYGAQGVDVTGNLFANNRFRNPAIHGGASAYVGSNLIYNPGENSIHLYGYANKRGARASIVSNVIVRGPDTANMSVFQAPLSALTLSPGAILYLSGNCLNPPSCNGAQLLPVGALAQGYYVTSSREPPVSGAANVETWVLRYAGARPSNRMAADRAIVDGARNRTGRIIAAPPSNLGASSMQVVRRVAAVPSNAFADAGGKPVIWNWLCQQHRAVGGGPSARCP